MKTLVWLASYPKSGNTWMRMLFAAYQKQPGAAELELSDAFRTTMSESRREAFERLAGKKDLTIEEIDELREAVQIELAQRVRPPVLIKTHNARVQHRGFPIIRRELTLGAIYVVRNPLDVVDSVADHWGVDHDRAIAMMNDPKQTIGGPQQELVTQYLDSWSGHVTSWIDHQAFPVHIVCYEDLLNRTAITFRNALTFLGWPVDVARVEQAVEQTRFERLQQRESEGGFQERSRKSKSGAFFRRGQAGRWSDLLSAAQISAIHITHGEVMRRCGYLLDV